MRGEIASQSRAHFEQIEMELAAVSELREKPAGNLRITATDNATNTILLPKLTKFLRAYPDIKVEVIIDYGLADIVTQRYDAGVRLGEQVAKNMIAVRIGPDMRMAVVGAPSYFKGRTEPKTPQDLVSHNCINLRLPRGGSVCIGIRERWARTKGARRRTARVQRKLSNVECSSRRGRPSLRPRRPRGRLLAK